MVEPDCDAQLRLTPVALIALLNVAGACYYTYFFFSHGYLPSPFVWAKSETFMDLFHTMHWAFDDGRYTEWKSVYPPLNFHVLRLMNFVFQGPPVGLAPQMRANSPYVIAGLCLLYLAVPALILRTAYWRPQGLTQKFGVYLAISLSAPMLFALERGNLILFCPILLAVAVSREGLARAICIALLVNLKPYFVLLCALYVLRKDWKGLASTVLLSGGIFLLSGLALDPSFLLFFRNLFGFGQSENLFASMEVLALPSSISAFSYVLQLPHGQQIGHPKLISFIALAIEVGKWLGIVICILALLTKRQKMRDVEIFVLIVAIITNLGVSVGGYSLIYYAALLPAFLTMRNRYVYIGILVTIAMPLDIVTLMSRIAGGQHSFLSDSDVTIRWTLGLGSVVRPIANYVLMLLLSWEILRRERGVRIVGGHAVGGRLDGESMS